MCVKNAKELAETVDCTKSDMLEIPLPVLGRVEARVVYRARSLRENPEAKMLFDSEGEPLHLEMVGRCARSDRLHATV